MRYTDRLAAAGIAPSVGSQGDAFDNALAESVIGLYKTEVIRRRGPWHTLEAVEFAGVAVLPLVPSAPLPMASRIEECGQRVVGLVVFLLFGAQVQRDIPIEVGPHDAVGRQ